MEGRRPEFAASKSNIIIAHRYILSTVTCKWFGFCRIAQEPSRIGADKNARRRFPDKGQSTPQHAGRCSVPSSGSLLKLESQSFVGGTALLMIHVNSVGSVILAQRRFE